MKKISLLLVIVLCLGFSGIVNAQALSAWAGDHNFPGDTPALYFTKMIRNHPGSGYLEIHTIWAEETIDVGTLYVINQPNGNDLFMQAELNPGWEMTEVYIGYGLTLYDFVTDEFGNPIVTEFQIHEQYPFPRDIDIFQIMVPNGYYGFVGHVAINIMVSPVNGQASHGQSSAFTVDEPVPSEYKLSEPYPNPFNASATVSVTLPEAAPLTVDVFSVTGQYVMTLADGVTGAGNHQFHLDAANLASGVYFIHATVPGHLNEMKKVMLVR